MKKSHLSTLSEFYSLVVARSLRFLGVGLAVYYGLLALVHPYFLEEPSTRTMVLSAAISAVAMASVALVGPRVRGVHPPHLVLLAMALLVLFNSVAHVAVSESLLQSTNVALAIFGGGLLFLSRAYFVSYALTCLVAWWAVTARVGLTAEPEWTHWAFALGSATLLAGFTLKIRRRMLEEAQSLRLSVDMAEAARRAEAEKRELQEQVVYAEKLKSLGLLAGGIAHDFNNILVGVLGNASLALEVLDSQHPAHRLVSRVQDSAENAAQLTRQMLDFSGSGRILVDSVDLAEEIGACAELLRASTPSTIELEIDLPSEPVWLEADPTQLRQVVLNLVVNGADAMADRHGRLSVRVGSIEVAESWLRSAQLGSDLPPGPYGLLEVADEGPGFAPDILPQIFDPFFSTKESGRGLGLATVAGIVRSHGGAARFVSVAKKGVTASILLPLAEEPKPVPRPAAEPAEKSGSRPSLIVVADDEATVLELAREALERAGHRVLAAVDGGEAVDLVRRRAPDLVILDMTMPRMSGSEVIAELSDYTGPIIVTSGFSEESLSPEMSARICGFLAKPFRAEDLDAAVTGALS